MAPLRYAAKFDPFFSLDYAGVEGGGPCTHSPSSVLIREGPAARARASTAPNGVVFRDDKEIVALPLLPVITFREGALFVVIMQSF